MKTDEQLEPELYHVAREKGTEAPFSGKYWDSREHGMYKCAVCGTELFSSDTKFSSGTGWPSFTEPADLEQVELKEDNSLGTRLPAPERSDGGQVKRTEVVCKTCGAHLGHVFDDGPADKGGQRYCINSVCLILDKGK